MNKLLTPRQQEWWERRKNEPGLALLIDRLGLELVKQPEVERGEAIQARVNGWIEQLALSPKMPRVVEHERVIPERKSPFENPDLSWLKPGECPF